MTTLPPPVETDCGQYCAAFSYLTPEIPFSPFGFDGYESGIMFVWDANPTVWSHVQCMSVTDRFTTSRVCCQCSDPLNCPFYDFGTPNPPYCNANEADGCGDDALCKQLAAGCGVSLYDLANQANGLDGRGHFGRPGNTDWGADACDEGQILRGECGLCKVPLWCDDEQTSPGFKGTINTSTKWVEHFFDRDGGAHLGVRQCVWKPSQKQMFVETMNARFKEREKLPRAWDGRRDEHANVWNEVSMYVKPNDRALAQLMWDNLLGVVFLRSVGTDDEEADIQELVSKWRDLGTDVPMFRLTAEDKNHVRLWHVDEPVDLTDRNTYNLEDMVFTTDGG